MKNICGVTANAIDENRMIAKIAGNFTGLILSSVLETGYDAHPPDRDIITF
jgi:hypothetical protein